ncbi:MAG: trigger factor family protein [Prevotellaceae bacterium]|jgi:trigger factor|nr:trigger factor family protein [Prevotellaceae bacterium]
MDITKQDIDDNRALLKVTIVKTDYEEAVKKSLNAYRRKADVKGFRVGMAPIWLIQKMYGHAILIEEMQKIVLSSLEKYIEDEKLEIIGEPIPYEDEQKQIDLDNQSEFEFVFEIGYAPKYELCIDKTITIPFYHITVSESTVNSEIERLRIHYGKFESAEIADENGILYVDASQDCENAISIEDTFISLTFIENQEQKARLSGLKKGDTIAINLNEIYTDDNNKIMFLKSDNTKNITVNPEFNITIRDIQTHKKADFTQEFFDAVYGNNAVNSEEEFVEKVKDNIIKYYENISNSRFLLDANKELVKKAGLKYPNTFLKKWLLLEGKSEFTKENIDNKYESFIHQLSWQKICDHIVKENDMQIDDADIKNIAINIALEQLRKYGLHNMANAGNIERLAQNFLNDKQRYDNIVEEALRNKITEYLKTAVQLEEKTVSIDEFDKLWKS